MKGLQSEREGERGRESERERTRARAALLGRGWGNPLPLHKATGPQPWAAWPFYWEVSAREGNRNAGMLEASTRPTDHSPTKE